jgi:hypothetical protein
VISLFRKYLASLSLCLILFILFGTPAMAEVQAGLDFTISEEYTGLSELSLSASFSKHFRIRGVYDWEDETFSAGIIYLTEPSDKLSPYYGLSFYDLTDAGERDLPFKQRLQFIAGYEFRPNPASNFSAAAELRLIPGDLFESKEDRTDNTITFGLSFNYLFPRTRRGDEYDNKDLVLLAKLIAAEAVGEPYNGQVAVGAVILNRVQSASFPNTIRDVIYQPGQFSSLPKIPSITPTDSCLQAAQDALEGKDPSKGALYFYNPATCSKEGLKFFRSGKLKVVAKIGNHVFLR